MKRVYIILMRTNTYPSKLIKLATHAEYTHSSITLTPSPHNMYSFSRRRPRNFLIGGFINEDTKKSALARYPNAPCEVLELEVDEKAYEKMEFLIEEFNRQYKKHKYNFVGIITPLFGIKTNFKYRYTCSQFVSTVLYLSDAVELPKHPSLMRPMDFLNIPQLHSIYKGPLSNISFSSEKIIKNY